MTQHHYNMRNQKCWVNMILELSRNVVRPHKHKERHEQKRGSKWLGTLDIYMNVLSNNSRKQSHHFGIFPFSSSFV